MLSESKGDMNSNDWLQQELNVCYKRRKPEGEKQKEKERSREL